MRKETMMVMVIKKSKTVIKPQFWSPLLGSCFHLGLGAVEIFARRRDTGRSVRRAKKETTAREKERKADMMQ